MRKYLRKYSSTQVLAQVLGRGVPLTWSKPDPVAIRLMAQKTPCPNFQVRKYARVHKCLGKYLRKYATTQVHKHASAEIRKCASKCASA